jgi:hypothetical protein
LVKWLHGDAAVGGHRPPLQAEHARSSLRSLCFLLFKIPNLCALASLREPPVLRGNDQGLVELVPPTFYQTKPCARRASSKFQAQGSKFGTPRPPREHDFTKRTHSAKRVRCKPRRHEGHKESCKFPDCSGMRLPTGSAVIDRRYSLTDFTKRTQALGAQVRSFGFQRSTQHSRSILTKRSQC